nr:gonadal somatic cell derived factor isoform X3 [Danio rerio]|eukprot:XP_009293328.1 gonadal somatic cell derived factor isoform X3 [Danio rerio]
MLLRLVLLLLAFPLGEMFVLHPSPEDQSHREQEIKKIILKSLHLPKEPSNSLSQLEHLRESLKNSIHSPPGNSSLPEDSGNSSCCRRSSQVLMKGEALPEEQPEPQNLPTVYRLLHKPLYIPADLHRMCLRVIKNLKSLMNFSSGFMKITQLCPLIFGKQTSLSYVYSKQIT